MQKHCVILPTFDDKISLVKKTFSQDLLKHPNFVIFENNSDLLNLVALISKMDLVISPSTGNIHIADNLGIPSIGLFSYKDTIAWNGEHMHYIVLDKISHNQAIQQTLKEVQKLFHQDK